MLDVLDLQNKLSLLFFGDDFEEFFLLDLQLLQQRVHHASMVDFYHKIARLQYLAHYVVSNLDHLSLVHQVHFSQLTDTVVVFG